MLHSTLPRAFLPPGLGYLGGYYGDDVYSTAASYVPCIQDPRISNQPDQLETWESAARPTSPLDLSLKAPPLRSEDIETIEVTDNEDLRCRARSQRKSVTAERSYSNGEDLSPRNEAGERERSLSVHNYHSYGDTFPSKDVLDPESSLQHARLLQKDILPSSSMQAYNGYVLTKALNTPEVGHKNYQADELLLGSHLDTQSYHQQLLLTTPQLQGIHAPMTPPSTPSPPQCPRRRPRDEPDVTPPRASGGTSKQTTNNSDKLRPKKKHARRLKFDEDTSSPVSGTVILGPDEAVVTGDIDPAFNIVEVTEEARAELAKIENRLGPYQCKLCRQLHDDAFQLAQHRCSRIAHVEYRCPECDKRFSCPANLASHRRWHKPRMPNGENNNQVLATSTNASSSTTDIACARCDVKFTRPAALRKHLATQHPETNNNLSILNNNDDDNNKDNNANNNDDDNNFNDLNISMSGKPLCVPMHLGNVINTIP